MQITKRKKRGFTLVEVILAVVVLGVLALVLGNAFSDATESAQDKVKTNNAAKITAMIRDAESLGATVGNGATNDIDTRSMTTIITSLENGVTVNGVTIRLDEDPNAAAYEFSAGPPPVVTAQLGQPGVNP